MDFDIALTLSIIGLAMVLFLTEKLSIDTVSIGVMILFLITGILDIKEGLAGFSNSATLTVASMFVLSAAIFSTGVLDSFSYRLSKQAKKSELRLMLTLMVSAGVLSAFISDTAVVALLMPAVIQLSKNNQIPPSKLLMPLSFGALMGGVCTLLGTSTNILVSGIAENAGLPAFGIFEMSIMGLVFLLFGILYMAFVGRFLLPSRKSKELFGDSMELGNYLSELIITEDFTQLQEQVSKQKLFNKLPIQPLQIIREDGQKIRVYPNTAILKGDLIRFSSDKETLEKLKAYPGIKLKAELVWEEELVTGEEERLYEAVITPSSFLIKKSIKELNFKELFNQVLIIGIRHRKGMLDTLLTRTRLAPGDILLLRATEESIQSIYETEGLLLVSESRTRNLNKTKTILTLIIMTAVLALAILNILPIVVSAMAGAVAMVITRVITTEQAYKAIDWKVILMLVGILSMGAALEKTGGSALLGESIVNGLGEYGPRIVLGGIFGLTFLLTNVMSNNATAALLAPIAISIANSLGVDSRPLLMAVTFAASLSFMTPMGYQTNTMIYSPGNYNFKDYLLVGTPLNILFWIIGTIGIPILFPF
ncbi:SLC13 family permease [Algoriphagus machipongonensis]|uniref:TrkA domain protein n=1 Tax=Algoriphagus machipongonensis TaxID=388413 RepID=A3HRY0_9BACT|nr:SLC13 family permease [Algoriphagus machipongonensis]EAZ82598.1 TrkA domain protein [Algoriphagus machipongonensis]